MVRIDDDPDPVRLGKAEDFHAREIFDLSAAVSRAGLPGPEERLVHAEVMRVAVQEDTGFP